MRAVFKCVLFGSKVVKKLVGVILRKFVALILSIGFALVPLTSQAAPAVYKNCAALNAKYPYGLAQKANAKNLGKGPIEKPKVDSKLYVANKKLDLDKDGIVCEKLKPAEDSSAQPVPTNPGGIGFASINKDSWRVAQAAVLTAVSAGTAIPALTYQLVHNSPNLGLPVEKSLWPPQRSFGRDGSRQHR